MAGFRDFLISAEAGGNGNRYTFGSDTSSKLDDSESIEDTLYHIKVLSEAALNKLDSSKVDEIKYVKLRLLEAKRELRDAYLIIMNANR
jgi:hypothetical protein|tara:strand:+ start:11786 stop:12052 length:267 start_codon:yes stop_codon:yes gene_type:complete